MSSTAAAGTPTAGKPLLRGWSHVLAAIAAAVYAVMLLPLAGGDWLRLTTLSVYCVALVWLFACSAVYHILAWSPSRRKLLRSIDRSNIYLVIAATSTAISANVLDGWQRIVPLAAVWVLTLVGITVTVIQVRVSAALRVALYILTGLSGIFAAPALIAALPFEASIAIIGGALLYIVGGLIYAVRRPDPFPRFFGYHEIFHLFVIAASGVFGAIIWRWVLPLTAG